jgi:hypothetical protein
MVVKIATSVQLTNILPVPRQLSLNVSNVLMGNFNICLGNPVVSGATQGNLLTVPSSVVHAL